ncbi:MAG: SAM-dependent methyltransferase [Burkholderiales bacterium]
MQSATQLALSLTEKGLIPDHFVRAGIRRLCKARLLEIRSEEGVGGEKVLERFIAQMDSAPIALVPKLANEQHYEVPPGFYTKVLGRHLKYSCCYWEDGVTALNEAETESLRLTCENADLQDGQHILELGCGWGSLTLWMARHYPKSKIVAVSNSYSQRTFIMQQARDRGLDNLEVITSDMNAFGTDRKFDRVVSVEMFEHMRNWRLLFARVHDWLRPGGRFFMHVFCHRGTPYAFEEKDASDWMSRYFFTGGMMPSTDLAPRFQDDLRLVRQWGWDGTHYAKTANAWLENLDANRFAILPVFRELYGMERADAWFERWRIFFMACAELFGYSGGKEWGVSHYLFERSPPRAAG